MMSGLPAAWAAEPASPAGDALSLQIPEKLPSSKEPISDQNLPPLPLSSELDSGAAAVTNIPGIPEARFVTIVGQKAYVNVPDKVIVLDTSTNAVLKEIAVQTDLYLGSLGNKVYVPNGRTNVAVIDTTNDTIIKNITVADGAKTIIPNGVKLYVTSRLANAVTVIDTRTDTVAAIVPVGIGPFYGSSLGDKVYISNTNKDAGSISVIDTKTDTVTSTIHLERFGEDPVLEAFIGTTLYVSIKNNDTVVAIDTLTNEVITDIRVGRSPEMILAMDGKAYVNNRGGDSVSVIDGESNTVIKTIPVGSGPYYLISSGKRIFVANHGENTVSVINSETDTVEHTLTVGNWPFYLTATPDKIFVPNPGSSFLSIININELDLPELLSFTTNSRDRSLKAGQSIQITANFNRPLAAGSVMSLTLNSTGSLRLTSVAGNSLTGTYTVRDAEKSPDLSVRFIDSASITDLEGHHRTSYTIPYSPGSFVGENSLIARNIGDARNINIGDYAAIGVGDKPYQVSAPVTISGTQRLFVANQGSNTVSVVDLASKSQVASIDVGSEPYGLALANVSGTAKLYVANTNGNTVSVIDTLLNRVIKTISVGLKPYYVAAFGGTMYVTNGQSNTVSVISAATNTVIDTIPVGAYPRGIKAYGNELYVANYGDPYYYSGGNSISVINGLTNRVTATILLPVGSRGPRGIAVAGNRVYVANYLTNNVSVIDPVVKAVVATIPVGAGPRGVLALDGKIYVENFDAGTVSVINASTNAVVATVTVGHSPAGLSAVGSTIYLSNFQDNNLLLLDSKSNTLLGSRGTVTPFAEGETDPAAVDPAEAPLQSLDLPADSLKESPLPDDLTAKRPAAAPSAGEQLSLKNLSLYNRFKGSIILKVEDGGKAFYLSPLKPEALPLGTPEAGLVILRNQGVGIRTADLNRIPLGLAGTADRDTDHDGLSDRLEQALGSNPVQADSDKDGFPDGIEAAGGYNLFGSGKAASDPRFAARQLGRILIQAEGRGEAWYVNPRDAKRYYLGRPEDALRVMSRLGLGISNSDFLKL